MMLKVLPSHISNLIAAGEVVQRPSSVVKELVENSIDAGADSITVNINDAGRTLIQIIDNGCGLSPSDAKLAFERHATSKITEADDLLKILTYGFRGEALASIVAIAEVCIKTRTAETDTGYEVSLKASEITAEKEISCPVGTNISIRNIFYNIPARRKFLKSDAAEYKHIVSEFIRIALINTDISLSLTHNNKPIFNIAAGLNIKQRIQILIGKGITRELINIQNKTNIIEISGLISRPEDAKKSSSQQFLFVNNRFFRSPMLYKAIQKGYEQLIPQGTSPSYFINFKIDPEKLDVNIHPTKTEVKFEEESMIFTLLRATIRESLGINSFMPSIDFETDGNIEIPSIIEANREYSSGKKAFLPPQINFDPNFNPFNDIPKNEDFEFEDFTPKSDIPKSYTTRLNTYSPNTENNIASTNSYLRNENGYGGLFQDSLITGKRPIIKLRHNYLVTTVKSGLLLIHISRAKERILYDEYIKKVNNNNVTAFRTLHPIMLELTIQTYTIVKENLNLFNDIGFDIKEPDHINKDNETQLIIIGVPFEELLADICDLAESIESIARNISENEENTETKDIEIKVIREREAITMAKIGSRSNSSNNISPIEAQIIVDRLFACSSPGYTPSGKKTMSILALEDLDKLFKQ